MTINGVKKILNNNNLNIDENEKKNINSFNIKIRLNKINNLIKNLKKIKWQKNHTLKVRLVPEAKPDSAFYYYVKKPSGGEKAKIKLKARKYNPVTRKHEIL